jgi:hypothetical protein
MGPREGTVTATPSSRSERAGFVVSNTPLGREEQRDALKQPLGKRDRLSFSTPMLGVDVRSA